MQIYIEQIDTAISPNLAQIKSDQTVANIKKMLDELGVLEPERFFKDPLLLTIQNLEFFNSVSFLRCKYFQQTCDSVETSNDCGSNDNCASIKHA